MDNPSDIFSLCRLCLVKDQVNISIFDEQGDIRQIFLKISSCLPIKVSRDDKLPKKICDDCSNKLDLLYEFWNSSANAEKTLLSWLGQAGVKDAGGTINAVAQQIAKPTETLVKLESGVVEGNSVLISPCVNNVDNESFNELPKEESEAAPPPPKRTRRSAAVKAQINIIPESEDDDDIDTTDLPTKLEDGPEDSDAEDKDPSYTEVPGTSANDQPGPSGVGKAGGVEAPFFDTTILNNLIYGPGISITPVKPENYDFNNYTADNFHSFQISNSVFNKILEPQVKMLAEFENNKNVLRNDDDNDDDDDDFNYAISAEETEIIKPEDTDIQPNILDCLLKNDFKSKKKIVRKNKRNKSKKKNHPDDESSEKIPLSVDLDEPIECDICNETFKNNVAFALHSILHAEDNKYFCHLCEFRNNSKYHIEMHVRAHEGTTKYKCEVCGKAFTISTHAIEHKYFHTGEKPFQCEICGKHFMFSWFLTSHRRTQHWEIVTGSPLVKYDCKICNKHYTSSTGLKRHNMNHHGSPGVDNSVLCDICGKSLSTKEKLKFHRRIHTGYKPFACEICTKSFSRKEQLKEHERVHTGEKPYICKFCGKGFTQRSPLRIHERTHTGERPYTCLICQKGFISKGVMDTHMKTCSVPRPTCEPQLTF